MNRLEKELRNRGIIYTCENESGYDPYEAEEQLVTITSDFIITLYTCNVLEPVLKMYDRHFNYIGQQSTEKDEDFFGEKAKNPWSSFVSIDEEVDEDMSWLEDYGPELNEAWDEQDDEDDYPNDAEDAELLDAMFGYYHGYNFDDDRH